MIHRLKKCLGAAGIAMLLSSPSVHSVKTQKQIEKEARRMAQKAQKKAEKKEQKWAPGEKEAKRKLGNIVAVNKHKTKKADQKVQEKAQEALAAKILAQKEGTQEAQQKAQLAQEAQMKAQRELEKAQSALESALERAQKWAQKEGTAQEKLEERALERAREERAREECTQRILKEAKKQEEKEEQEAEKKKAEETLEDIKRKEYYKIKGRKNRKITQKKFNMHKENEVQEAKEVIKQALEAQDLAAHPINFFSELICRSAEDTAKLLAEIERLNPDTEIKDRCLSLIQKEMRLFSNNDFDLRKNHNLSKVCSFRSILTKAEQFLSMDLEDILKKSRKMCLKNGLYLHYKKTASIKTSEKLAALRLALVLLCSEAQGVPITELEILGKDWFNTSPIASIMPITEDDMKSKNIENLIKKSCFSINRPDRTGKIYRGLLNFAPSYTGAGSLSWHPDIPVNPYIYDQYNFMGMPNNINWFLDGARNQLREQDQQIFSKSWRKIPENAVQPGDLYIGASLSIILSTLHKMGVLMLTFNDFGPELRWIKSNESIRYTDYYLRPLNSPSTNGMPLNKPSLFFERNNEEEENKEEKSNNKTNPFKRKAEMDTKYLEKKLEKFSEEVSDGDLEESWEEDWEESLSSKEDSDESWEESKKKKSKYVDMIQPKIKKPTDKSSETNKDF